jgi:hypothetical protein
MKTWIKVTCIVIGLVAAVLRFADVISYEVGFGLIIGSAWAFAIAMFFNWAQ